MYISVSDKDKWAERQLHFPLLINPNAVHLAFKNENKV